MNDEFINHYSNNYKLDVSKLPCKAVDRFSVVSAIIFFLLSLILIFVGTYELANGLRPSALEMQKYIGDKNSHAMLISPTMFDLVIIALGLGIAVSMILAVIRYKKIHFDGDFFRIVLRPAFGPKIMMTEPLYMYKGVQLRSEFLQFGLINRTKYIIELLHADPQKTIPLYISTSEKNIRTIWYNYAKTLRMPAIIITDGVPSTKNYQDLGLSIKELVGKMQISDISAPKTDVPNSLYVNNKKNKKIIKVTQLILDAFNILAIICLAVFAVGLFYIVKNHKLVANYFSEAALLFSYIVCAIVIIYCIFQLSKRDKLIIKQNKIVLLHKFICFSRKYDEVDKDKIEDVSIICNPASGRSYVAIISGDKLLTMGKKLPLSDLRWLRQYVLSEIVK